MEQNEICAQVKVNSEKISQAENRLDKIDVVLEKLRNRLPLWATILIGGLFGAIGYLIRV
jgi:hypothetical protein